MKKLFVVFLFFILGFNCYAQKEVSVGAARSALLYSKLEDGVATNYQTPYDGLFVSFTGTLVQLTDDISLRAGLMASYGLYQDSEELDRDSYVTLPLDLRTSGYIGRTMVYCSFGLRFAYGLSSTVSPPDNPSASIDLYNSAVDYSRYDALYGAELGIVFGGKVLLKAGIDRGLVVRMSTDDTKLTRNVLSAGLGIAF